MIGMCSGHTIALWRSKLLEAVRVVLMKPAVHKRFETVSGQAAIAGLKLPSEKRPLPCKPETMSW